MTSSPLPPWPRTPPAHGRVELRAVAERDAGMARELSSDPYVPHVSSLPADASEVDALAWVERQQGRHAERAGFSFTIVEAATEEAVGHCGLWLEELDEGRGTAGCSIIPSARGRWLAADALSALTVFGWTLPGLFRIALYIEPWNVRSIRTAERAGYAHEGLLRSHRVIAGQRRDMHLYTAIRPVE
ncbi:GNAT family N-acetyltransferase [Aeromicrobium sp. CF4.19]|uniref:GNAT family N-acetyltransferase n=1 Tax=Aeromicrobium sp. CF4.19 TaxID=3373082 RepID=UPI003EE7F19A